MKKQSVQLTIIDSGMKGEGIAKLNGKPVFVASALVGEEVLATIVEEKKNFYIAKVFKVLKPSPHRVQPPCAIYYNCGGCNMQHIAYEEQLHMKHKHVTNTLNKQLTVPVVVQPVVKSELQLGYRNKAQLPVSLQEGKVVVGFYKPGTHQVVPLNTCPLHDKWLEQVVQAFLSYANSEQISVYNETSKTGILRHLVVRKLENKMSIVVVVNGTVLPKQEILLQKLKDNLKAQYEWSLFVNYNNTHSNVIMGQTTKLLFGKEQFVVNVMGLKVSVSPQSFFQVNDGVSKQIYEHVVRLVTGAKMVVDAYSGAGLMTSLIAKNVGRSVGIEIVPQAVKDANLLKQNNHLKNVSHICGDVSKELPLLAKTLTKEEKQNFIVVLDPPRKGCAPSVLETLKQQQPTQIVYVSCNPATLGRDLAILVNDGQYEIILVQPYDMFPQTAHVETLVQLKRK